MNYMILFVLHDLDHFEDILDAWEDAGAPGMTMLPSTGLGRMRKSALREDLPLIPRLDDLLTHQEIHSHTIFTVVDDESLIDRILEATQAVVGDLNQPNTGILIALPVARAYGIRHYLSNG